MVDLVESLSKTLIQVEQHKNFTRNEKSADKPVLKILKVNSTASSLTDYFSFYFSRSSMNVNYYFFHDLFTLFYFVCYSFYYFRISNIN